MGMAKTGLRSVVLIGTAAIALAACSGGGSTSSSSPAASAGQKGGTLYVLTHASQINYLDPQRNYTGEDLAFVGAFMTRSLENYTYVPGSDGWNLTPDLATDLGTASADKKTWSFTIRDGVKWQDGTTVTCDEVKYGVSRTFATDIINAGPTYAIKYLDIPTAKDGSSTYKGPYNTSKSNDTAAYDKAVTCDGSTITFHLKVPVPDFNATTTLEEFAPVEKKYDSNPAKYGDNLQSNGPYQIQTYKKGQKLVLVRNTNWDPATDPERPAYPDTIEMDFNLDPNVVDQRMIKDSGNDQMALMRDNLEPNDLASVFNNPQTKPRAVNEYDPYQDYIAINTSHITNLKLRQAIMVAFPRAQYRSIYGGDYAGDLADGYIKPNVKGYAPTNIWTTGLGQPIPDNGDATYAKQLIQESGQKMPTLTYDYMSGPTGNKFAGALVTAMAAAGITVKPNPIDSGVFYGQVFDDKQAGDLIWSGWGPDWPNASTIIPSLLTPDGGFDLARYNDPTFNKAVTAALNLTDLNAQIAAWNKLNTQAVEAGTAVPTLAERQQRMFGGKVGGAYIWAPYGSWNYGTIWIQQ
jgi:peptide/nickel transport system substrate-binding protein